MSTINIKEVLTDLLKNAGVDEYGLYCWRPVLTHAARLFEINTPVRLCAWIAQISFETEGFTKLAEVHKHNVAGDAERYKSRGLLRIVGREAYGRVGDGIGVSLLTNPEFMETPGVAALAAGWLWKGAMCNEFADKLAFSRIVDTMGGGRKAKKHMREFMVKCSTCITFI